MDMHTQDYNTGSSEYATQAYVVDFMRRIYMWMTAGLFLTGGIAYYVSTNEQLMQSLFSSTFNLVILIAIQLGLVIVLSFAINKISSGTATLLFLLYSATVGVTTSVIFVVYDLGSIYNAFVVAAGMFLAMSIYGTVTKRDLTSLGGFMFMGLVGIIIASLVNLIFKSHKAFLVISCIGVIVFVGLTAYDTQKIRQIAYENYSGNEDSAKKSVIMGALALYLDFINLFLYLLRLLGNRK